MSKPKFTPGPWSLTERKVGVKVDYCTPICTTDTKNKNREADACLIAAAPDLLEKLEWALQFVATRNERMGLTLENAKVYEETLALIARVTGKQHVADTGYGEPCEGRR